MHVAEKGWHAVGPVSTGIGFGVTDYLLPTRVFRVAKVISI